MDKSLKNKMQKGIKEIKKNSAPNLVKKKNQNQKVKEKIKVNDKKKVKEKEKPKIMSKNLEEIKKEFEDNNELPNNNMNKSLKNFNPLDNDGEK